MSPKVSPAKSRKTKRAESPAERMEPVAKNQKTSGWVVESHNVHVYNPGGLDGRTKVAGFDLDGTIIDTKSGKTFAKDAGDWKFLYPDVPGKLKSLYQKDGFNVVIFTNQAGFSKGKTSVSEWKQKVDAIMKAVGIPMMVFVAPSDGMNRKPAPGMWNVFEEEHNSGVKVDRSQSVYVGDAAGRPASDSRKKKDFSCSDRLFAFNVGVPFKTPEEFFLNKKPEKFAISSFDPRKYAEELTSSITLLTPTTASATSSSQELIVLVGPPGVGKSHFARESVLKDKNYVHINRDNLKTWQKCVKETENGLDSGRSVVVDNTNGDLESRKRYLDCAKQAKVPCRCFVFVASIEHAKHNNKFRELVDEHHEHIPEMVFRMWKSKFVMPTVKEGFTEVVQVHFLPKFSNEDHERLYNMYLCES